MPLFTLTGCATCGADDAAEKRVVTAKKQRIYIAANSTQRLHEARLHARSNALTEKINELYKTEVNHRRSFWRTKKNC